MKVLLLQGMQEWAAATEHATGKEAAYEGLAALAHLHIMHYTSCIYMRSASLNAAYVSIRQHTSAYVSMRLPPCCAAPH
jgi:hypothetical protein